MAKDNRPAGETPIGLQDLSEEQLGCVTGGFNPQPDPPKVLQVQYPVINIQLRRPLG